MIITNENYKDVLPELNQFDPGDKIIFTVGETEFHYYPVNHLFLKYTGYGGNDAIFEVLELDPYDFCAKSYRHLPFGGIFPEVPDGDPRKLVQVTYDLFEECEKRCLPPVKRIELSDLSINLLL